MCHDITKNTATPMSMISEVNIVWIFARKAPWEPRNDGYCIPDGRGVLLWRCGKTWFAQLWRQAQQSGRELQPRRDINILGET